MSELLLINPRKRGRKAKSAKRRRNPAAKAARKVPLFANPRRRRRRSVAGSSLFRRRRRNPISARGLLGGVVPMAKNAAIGAVGAIGVDLAMGQVNKYLPANLQMSATQVGAGDAIKALVTVVLGRLLAKPTRGLSNKAAEGALTVQLATIGRRFVPATMALAYASPAYVVRGTPRIGPNGVGKFTRPGSKSPLLNAFTRGATPLLSASRREMGPVR